MASLSEFFSDSASAARGRWMPIVDLHAQLTIKGVTKPLVLRTAVSPVGDDEMRLRTQATVNRRDFGVDGNMLGMIGDTAQISGDPAFRRTG